MERILPSVADLKMEEVTCQRKSGLSELRVAPRYLPSPFCTLMCPLGMNVLRVGSSLFLLQSLRPNQWLLSRSLYASEWSFLNTKQSCCFMPQVQLGSGRGEQQEDPWGIRLCSDCSFLCTLPLFACHALLP